MADLKSERGQQSGNKIQTYVQWKHPQDSAYILNCDGAAKGTPGPAGGGAIIRDQQGTYVSSLAANFGCCVAFKAEIMALEKGLELARNLRIHDIEVQLDSLACIQALKSNDNSHGEYTHIINHCRTMLSSLEWKVKVVHVYREGNRAADWLANHGVAQSVRLHIFQFVPVGISRILEEDLRGVALPRLIPP